MSPARTSRVAVLVLLVVAALLTAVLPASAATARSLSIKASSATPTVKATVTVTGVLSTSPKGATVTVQRLSGSRWVTARTARTTSTKGAYSAKVTVPSTAGPLKLRAVSKAIKNRKAATSRTTTLDVRRAVTITSAASPARTTLGSDVTVSGTVTPFVAGTVVTIQRVVGSKATSLTPTTTVDAAGRYTATITPASTGSFVYRAVVAGRTGYATATSPGRTVVVDPAPGPTITTTSLPTALKGAPYAANLTASVTGTWALRSGSLPPGLALSRAGAVTGTPTSDSTRSTFTVRFTGTTGGSTADRSYTVESKRIIATSAVPAGQVGVPYSTQLRTNAPVDGTWGTLGGLPAGLALSPDGVLSGTPGGSGSFIVVTFTPAGSSTRADDQQIAPEIETSMPTAPSTSEVTGGYMYGCRVVSEAGGSAACWGTNYGGQLGTGPVDSQNQVRTRATAITGGAPWRTLDAGDFYSTCGIRTDASLWCWGRGDHGILGAGGSDSTWSDTPRRVVGNAQWADVGVGATHACGVRTDGSLWCWGSGDQLGQPVAGSAVTTPVRVGTSSWRSVEVTHRSTCGVRTDDTLWCWGAGESPSQVAGSWLSVGVGIGSTCAVATDRSLWCWGQNESGQLGNDTTAASSSPVRVGPDTTWRQVSLSRDTSGGSTCATRTDGTAWCWGAGAGGQLGNGSDASSRVPVRVDRTVSWSSVAVGQGFACGVKNDGSQRCWGANSSAELGNGRLDGGSSLPTKVVG